ncbi:hypothetical protein SSX86_015976 [Deinandra increscens subsp. villosa]|uniref:DUF7054 domain-containing protein n=1 Tax=Deinandra increscens subsp. villosa TaxID=3103831 RepID=A0AAP0CX75_9ASTR
MLTLPFRKIVKDRVMKKGGQKRRILIKIDVLGSSGPIRLVVHEDTIVAAVIETALKSYAHEGRFPVLGTDSNDFFLYTPVAGTQALNPKEMIGSFGVRNFMLCRKPQQAAEITRRSTSGSWWKSWFSKTFNLKVTPN